MQLDPLPRRPMPPCASPRRGTGCAPTPPPRKSRRAFTNRTRSVEVELFIKPRADEHHAELNLAVTEIKPQNAPLMDYQKMDGVGSLETVASDETAQHLVRRSIEAERLVDARAIAFALLDRALRYRWYDARLLGKLPEVPLLLSKLADATVLAVQTTHQSHWLTAVVLCALGLLCLWTTPECSGTLTAALLVSLDRTAIALLL